MFRENLLEICVRNLKMAAVIFSIVLTLALASYAQNVNDDLKPKETTAKPATISPAKSTKKTVKPIKRGVSQPGKTKSKSFVKPVVVNSETPSQIINRFMNYRQTSSVTDRDWESVVAQTEKDTKSNPNNVTANAQLLIAQGQLAYNRRDYITAINNFKAALKMLPTSALPNYCLGQALLANGQAKAAEDSFKEAADQQKNFALAYKGIGDSLMAQDKKKSAVKYFKKATEISVKEGTYMP